jgi:hypothetical protein
MLVMEFPKFGYLVAWDGGRRVGRCQQSPLLGDNADAEWPEAGNKVCPARTGMDLGNNMLVHVKTGLL